MNIEVQADCVSHEEVNRRCSTRPADISEVTSVCESPQVNQRFGQDTALSHRTKVVPLSARSMRSVKASANKRCRGIRYQVEILVPRRRRVSNAILPLYVAGESAWEEKGCLCQIEQDESVSLR
jgi:hypothetical protein